MKDIWTNKIKRFFHYFRAWTVWKKLAVGCVLLIIAVAAVEFASNLKCIMLPENEKGILQIDERSIVPTGFVKTEGGYEYNGESGTIRLELNGVYVDKLKYSYDYDGLLDMQVTIGYRNRLGREEVRVIQDKNNAFIRESVINIDENVEYIELYTDEALLLEPGLTYIDLSSFPLTITDFSVVNEVSVNWYRVYLVSGIGGLLIIFWAFHEFFSRKLEYVFLMLSIVAGSILILLLPPNKVVWDEETHFMRAYQMSVWPGGQLLTDEAASYFICGIESWPYNLPASKEELQEQTEAINENALYEEGTSAVAGLSAGLTAPSYVLQALTIKAGRFLNLPFTVIYRLGRLAGLLVYCIVMTLGIKIIPVGKRILLAVGLMPEPLLLASCYSSDPTVMAFIILGIAMILAEAAKAGEKEKDVSWKTYFIGGAVLTWGILPKAVYAPLVLLFFLIPKECFKSVKKRRLMSVGVILLFLLLMSTFVLPQLISPSTSGDTRGGDVSIAKQMSLIFVHPITYIWILIKNIASTWWDYLIGDSVFRNLGHFGMAGLGYISVIYMAFLAVADNSGRQYFQMTAGRRIWMFLCAAAAIVLIWTSMYLTYTEPGSLNIMGVQGRYYLPLLLPIYLCVNSRRFTWKVREKTYNTAVTFVSGVIIFMMLWNNVYTVFCK